MKIAEFDTSVFSLEMMFEIEEYIRKKYKVKFGTGAGFGKRDWYVDSTDEEKTFKDVKI